MKIDKVTYQKTYSIGPYLTDRVGFEVSVNDPILMPDGIFHFDEPEEALSKLRTLADGWHKKEYPHLYEDRSWKLGSDLPEDKKTKITFGPLPVISKDKEPEDKRIAALIADIYSCTEIKILESYKIMVKSKPELQAAYDQVYKKLTTTL